MKTSAPQYLVGIDLGTTHTVVAYAPIAANGRAGDIAIFAVEQLVAPGQVAARSLLPSVRYHPADGELADADIAFLPSGGSAIIGEAARLLGAKTKGRLVTSAKSWLSHPSVDHDADILPWGGDDSVDKVSPIAASASYLAHIRAVWRHRFPDAPLEAQELVVTVPASFDEAARSLTLAAANIAGLPQLRLLEEPQAVCYDWLRRHAGRLGQALADVHLLLICDVGGGTTDLTLIKVEPGTPEPKLTRIGVGDHLMLGGDNIDLALAHVAESRLPHHDKRLSAAEFSQLIEQCRTAKERLLADDAPEQVNVALLGGGAKLIGGSRSATLSRDEVRLLALDGFFPLSGPDELPDKKRSGVVEFGLPYTAEPAVSKHIAAFLHRHQTAAQTALNGAGYVPDALLLNGGVFRSQPIAERLQELLAYWRGSPPVLLDNPHPELAVAFGAVGYALARKNRQLRIGGGAARSYFLLLDTDGVAQQQGVCILPRGSEEGDEMVLADRQFALKLGVPVRFNLASATGGEFNAGAIVNIDDTFQALPPLAVALEQRQHDAACPDGVAVVQLAVTQTEIGTLKIQCVSVTDRSQRWDVEFQIRKTAIANPAAELGVPADKLRGIEERVLTVFGAKSKEADPNAVKNLRADLEKIIGLSRGEWAMPLLRALFGLLLEGGKYRRRSVHHERVWLSLTGFCLRPGFGYPLDDWRVKQLWRLYPHGIQFVNEIQNWTEWWTLWRRIAGGLDQAAQQQIFSDIAKYIDPAAARQPGVAKQIKTRGYEDIVRLAAVLERLPAAQKVQLGNWLCKRLQKTGEPEQTWWALGRVGARVPFHGSSHNVVAAAVVTEWLTAMLKEDWKKSPPIGFAATLLARMSGDRERDIDDAMRGQVVAKLKLGKAPSSWLALVESVRELDEKEEKQLFGEALPPGLKLIDAAQL